jgi:hypothetical protein
LIGCTHVLIFIAKNIFQFSEREKSLNHFSISVCSSLLYCCKVNKQAMRSQGSTRTKGESIRFYEKQTGAPAYLAGGVVQLSEGLAQSAEAPEEKSHNALAGIGGHSVSSSQ